MPDMTEPAQPASVTQEGLYDNDNERTSRLGQAAAIVAIVAGVVFVVAVIFFAGFFVAGGWAGDGDRDGRMSGRMGPDGMPATCPMMNRAQ